MIVSGGFLLPGVQIVCARCPLLSLIAQPKQVMIRCAIKLIQTPFSSGLCKKLMLPVEHVADRLGEPHYLGPFRGFGHTDQIVRTGQAHTGHHTMCTIWTHHLVKACVTSHFLDGC